MVPIELRHATIRKCKYVLHCITGIGLTVVLSARVRAKIGQLVSDHSASPYSDPDLMSWKFSSPRSAASCLSS